MEKPRRILFLDMMRMVALFMMIQGHTLYAFIEEEMRDGGTAFFSIWRSLRGFTAPFFLFITGAVFMFLLLKNHTENKINPRIKIALRRVLTLFFWAYFLNFNFDIFRYGLQDGYLIQLYRVDVLHVIGTGLCLMLLTYSLYSSRKVLFLPFLIILFVLPMYLNWMVTGVDFSEDLPNFLRPYINETNVDTMFPLVPWLSYIMGGAILGVFIFTKQRKEGYEKTLWIYLLLTGSVFYLISMVGDSFERYYFGESFFWTKSPNLVFYRMGCVIIFGGLMALFALRINTLPKLLRQMSQNTLWLYISHLLIIYSVGKPLIYTIYGEHHRFGIMGALLIVMIMFALMVAQTKFIVWKNKKGGYGSLLRFRNYTERE